MAFCTCHFYYSRNRLEAYIIYNENIKMEHVLLTTDSIYGDVPHSRLAGLPSHRAALSSMSWGTVHVGSRTTLPNSGPEPLLPDLG